MKVTQSYLETRVDLALFKVVLEHCVHEGIGKYDPTTGVLEWLFLASWVANYRLQARLGSALGIKYN